MSPDDEIVCQNLCIEGGLNTYGYADGNSIERFDPKGLWAVSFGFALGKGFQLTVGEDALTGRGFIDFKYGLGLGITAKYDPNGGLPDSKLDDSCRGGYSLRGFASVGKVAAEPLDAAFVDAKIGANFDRTENGLYSPRSRRFFTADPKLSFRGKTYGIDFKIAEIGIGGTVYSAANSCECAK